MRHWVRPTTAGVSVALATAAGALGQTIPAFPGADGAGKDVTGARGGVVYHVTRLDGNEINAANGGRGNVPGSFAYGLNNANFPAGTKRTIVFDVGGTIWLGQRINSDGSIPTNGWDSQDPITLPANVTIAGQTAPGGINFAGGGLKVNGNNSVIRNVVIAPGYGKRALDATTGYADSYVFDGMNIRASGVVVDHITSVFATDESLSMDEVANNVTVQYSNISQGQNYPQGDAEGGGYTGHAFGSLIQPGTGAKISVVNNLYAHQKGRLPRVGTEAEHLTDVNTGSYNDFRNNVFYNWLGTGGGGASSQPSQNNFIGNYHRAGPGGDNVSGPNIVNASGGTGIFNGSNSSQTEVFHSGNVKDTNKNATAEFTTNLTNSDFGSSAFFGSPFTQIPWAGVTLNARGAYNNVLAHAGANWNNRNFIDARIFAETAAGTGKITAFGDDRVGYNTAGVYTTYPSASLSNDTEWNRLLALRPDVHYGGGGGVGAYARPAGFDTDQDGMPDTWEALHGTNMAVANNNGDFDADGYTDVEEYLNELAEWPASAPVVFMGGTNTRYAQITNWNLAANFNNTGTTTTSYWQPSKYDIAQVRSGTAVVDAVGQHAGMLEVVATLNVTGGWIDIADSLHVGTYTTFNASGLPVTNNGVGAVNQSGGLLVAPLIRINAGSTYDQTGGTFAAASIHVNGGSLLMTQGINPGAAVTISPGGLLRVKASSPTLPSHPAGDNAAVSLPASLTVAAGATLDLTNNDLVLDYSGASPLAAIEALVASGYNTTGNWLGDGITSSVAAADGNYVLAVADNAALAAPFGTAQGGSLFAGVDVDLTTILVKFTHRADINLDGVMTPDDAAVFGGNYDENQPAVWSTGDMNYDGVFTPDDAAIFGGVYDESLTSLPEPAAIAVLAALSGGMMRRRRR